MKTLLGLVAGLVLIVAPAWAAGSTKVAEAGPDHALAPPPEAVPVAAAKAKISGFRSASFGADETAVLAAIEKDFAQSGSAVTKSQNLADRTDVLSIKVPDVLNGGGKAEVGYVFGYRSKKLIQVSVIWSKGTDKSLAADRLLANGEALKSYFLTAGYVPETISTDAAIRDGIILFRGSDAEGHTVALMLHGATSAGADKGTQTFAPSSLLLFYISDSKTPDVFKIPAGRF